MKQFVYKASLSKGMSEQASREAGGKIFTFGSYRYVPSHTPSHPSTLVQPSSIHDCLLEGNERVVCLGTVLMAGMHPNQARSPWPWVGYRLSRRRAEAHPPRGLLQSVRGDAPLTPRHRGDHSQSQDCLPARPLSGWTELTVVCPAQSVPDAYVPVIKTSVAGVDFDFTVARVMAPTVRPFSCQTWAVV